MAYHSSYNGLHHKRSSRLGTHALTWIIVAFFIVVFIFSVVWFRSAKKKQPETKPDSIVNVLTPESVSQSVLDSVSSIDNVNATLINVSSKKNVGIATREIIDGKFHISMKSALGEIDREKQFYEAWLVRQVPYDFIPIGEFVTNDLGEFVLDWNGEIGKNYQAYNRVIITLQTKNGDPDPQGHVVEGEFGK